MPFATLLLLAPSKHLVNIFLNEGVLVYMSSTFTDQFVSILMMDDRFSVSCYLLGS